MAERNNSLQENFRLGYESTKDYFELAKDFSFLRDFQSLESFLARTSLLDIDLFNLKRKGKAMRNIQDFKRAISQTLGACAAYITIPCERSETKVLRNHLKRTREDYSYPAHYSAFA